MLPRLFCCFVTALLAAFAVVTSPPESPAQIKVNTATTTAKPKAKLHPRSLDEIKKGLADINNAPPAKGDALDLERDQALRRLKSYRYLSEVPYQNLAFDDQFTKYAQAAAAICEKIGTLDHKPPNPGLADADYQVALKGAGSSNLGMGYRSISASIDGYMDDSDPSNIPRVGHRRWCLNPTLMKVGLGKSGKFYGMYCMDRSQPKVPDFDVVCYPARGYMPVEYFNPRYARRVSPNPTKFKPPDPKTTKASIYEADDDGKKTGDALKLDFERVSPEPRGLPYCIIFRPAKIDMAPGKRYVVEIEGLIGTNRTGPLVYLVEFTTLR